MTLVCTEGSDRSSALVACGVSCYRYSNILNARSLILDCMRLRTVLLTIEKQ
jgi:hypothetical protein